MSQRYVPGEGSSYYPPRDRSPPRRRDSEYDSFTPRDAPRGPKALNDAPRGSGSAGSAAAARGRGPLSRGDFRPDPRDRQSSWTSSDRDRWPDRDIDRRERRPSPPPRGRTLPASDFRDARDPPRDVDPPRARRDSRDGPSPSGSYFPDARGRGGFRGRGRGDWDARSRSRSSLPYADDRDHFRPPSPRARSRSPPRRYERDARDDRDTDRFEGRRRDDERFDRDRDSDRYRRDPPHILTDTRRSSGGPSATTPTTPHVSTFGASQQPASAKASTDYERDPQKRASTVTTPAASTSTGVRRDTVKSETARPSSPPQPTEVPAFGFTPASATARQTSDGPWNVWKAPSDAKSVQQASSATTTAISKPVVAPPTASKVDIEPPKGPKADRVAETASSKSTTMEPLKVEDTSARIPVGPAASHTPKTTETSPSVVSPPTGPRQLSVPPSGPRNVSSSATSSTAFQAPTGPRAASGYTSSTPLGINVPTGPKADRATQGSGLHRVSTAPSQHSSWQWNKSPPSQTFQPSQITPAKRTSDGQERERPSFGARPTSSGASRPSITSGLSRNDERARSEESSMPLKLQSENIMAFSPPRRSDASKRAGNHFAEEEDAIGLDDDDFESLEAKFEKEKALLLSKKADLRQFEFWDETITEDITRLTRILHVENLFKAQERESATRHPNSIANDTPDEDIATPRTEEVPPMMIQVERSPTPEPTPPISTPEISALPYLTNGDLPMTPLSEKDTYQESLLRCDRLKDDVTVIVTDAKLSSEVERQHRLEEEFKTLYRPWKLYCEELDREMDKRGTDGREQEDQTTAEPVPEPVAPVVQGGTESRRRGMGFTSEYELQQILKASEEIERANQIKREREALLSKPDYDKEAVIPDILLFTEKSSSRFKDSSTLRESAESVMLYELNPPRDDFTPEEHETLLKNFKEFPKKFGKLAQALPDRDYKDCIHHYYATKWSGQYKPPKDKRKRPLKRGPRNANAQGKPKASSTLISGLGVNVPDVYEGDESGKPIHSMTDRGRPKRAAAPTFGEKETEDPAASTATPAKKGGKLDGDDLNGEKSAKKARTGKESRQKKPKQTGAPSMRGRRAESMSPEKPDIDGQVKAGILGQANLPNKGREFPDGSFAPGPGGSHPLAMQAQVDTPQPVPAVSNSQPQQQTIKTGPSSYWSVQDVSSFPTLLEHYGTDWQKIATQMGTKSSTMVKNYYQRLVNGGRTEFQQLAERGDSRKDKGDAPPPPIPPTAPAQARKRMEQPQHTAPRPLAPNLEGADNDEGTPPPHGRSIPPYQAQPATHYPTSQGLSERPTASHIPGENRPGLFASTQSPLLLTKDSRAGYPNDSYRGHLSHLPPGSTPQAHAPSGYPSRDREAYERGAASASRSRDQSWGEHVSDVVRSPYSGLPGSRPPMTDYERHRITTAQSPPVSHSAMPTTSERYDNRANYPEPVQQGRSRVEALLAGAPPRAGTFDPTRGSERPDPRETALPPMPNTSSRYDFDRPAPPRPTPTPSQQPPKVSNLRSLLNDDPPSQPPAPRTQTPPYQGYPPLAPPSRSSSSLQERRDPPSDPSRVSQGGYPPPAYPPSSQPPPRVDWLQAASGTRDSFGRDPHSSSSPRFAELARPSQRESSQQSPRMMPISHSGARTDFASRSGFPLSAVPGPYRTATPPQAGHQTDRFHGDRPHWESGSGLSSLGMGYDRRPVPTAASRGSPHHQSLGLNLAHHSQTGRSSVPPAPSMHRQDSNPSSFDRPGYRSSLANAFSPPPMPQYYDNKDRAERDREYERERERGRHGYPPPANR